MASASVVPVAVLACFLAILPRIFASTPANLVWSAARISCSNSILQNDFVVND